MEVSLFSSVHINRFHYSDRASALHVDTVQCVIPLIMCYSSHGTILYTKHIQYITVITHHWCINSCSNLTNEIGEQGSGGKTQYSVTILVIDVCFIHPAMEG